MVTLLRAIPCVEIATLWREDEYDTSMVPLTPPEMERLILPVLAWPEAVPCAL